MENLLIVAEAGVTLKITQNLTVILWDEVIKLYLL